MAFTKKIYNLLFIWKPNPDRPEQKILPQRRNGVKYIYTNIWLPFAGFAQLHENEPPRGKPRGIFKSKNHFIAASCWELFHIGFASLLDWLE